MNETPTKPFQIEFPVAYPRYEHEVPAKGWLDVKVMLGGRRYPVSFRDLANVQQGLASPGEDGLALFTETALVVLDRVTTANVERAVARLVAAGFFDHLAPLP